MGLVCKGHIQTGSQQNIVLLLTSRRIRDIDISEGILPSQPFAQFCDRAKIESRAVLASLV